MDVSGTMIAKNTFSQFKSYTSYQIPALKQRKSIAKSLAGASLGTLSALGITGAIFKNKNKNGFQEAINLIIMASCANAGGVIATSFGKDKNCKKRKWTEAGFQIMNMALPMILVSTAVELCKRSKSLNTKSAKIIGSITGMITGAVLATKITNSIKKKNEPKRKYTIKDSVANFDDVVATVKIGFNDIDKKIHLSKILPFIYIYSGTRAGLKE